MKAQIRSNGFHLIQSNGQTARTLVGQSAWVCFVQSMYLPLKYTGQICFWLNSLLDLLPGTTRYKSMKYKLFELIFQNELLEIIHKVYMVSEAFTLLLSCAGRFDITLALLRWIIGYNWKKKYSNPRRSLVKNLL